MGFNRGDKVVDVSGVIATVLFVDPARKMVAIKVTESDVVASMQVGGEYSVPEKQLQKYSSGVAEKVQKKKRWSRFRK
jgi:preprotein translocase subunit YajC